MGKSMKLGGGGRFEKLSKELASQPGVTNPDALAAAIGRKKYGASKMAGWAAKGRNSTKGSPSFTGSELKSGFRKLNDVE